MKNSSDSGSGVRDPVGQPQFIPNVTCAFMIKLSMAIQDNEMT